MEPDTIMDPLIRRLYDAPDPAPETPEEAAARRADLERRIDADIAETERRREHGPRETSGTIDVPQCMLDAFGLEEMNQ